MGEELKMKKTPHGIFTAIHTLVYNDIAAKKNSFEKKITAKF